MKRISFILKPVTVILLTVALVAISVGSLFFPSIDMNSRGSLSVSEESKEYLAGLGSDVSIYVVNGALHDSKFELFMKEYAKSSKRISVEFIDLSESDSLFAECGYSTPAELSTYTVIVKSDKRARLIDYYSMFYYYNQNFGQMSYSQYYEYYSMFSSYPDYAQYLESLVYDSEYYFYGDAVLTGVVEYVSLDVIPKAYISAAHGENSASEGNFAKLLMAMNYEFGVMSDKDFTAIPKDAGCIIINEPASDITKAEADSLRAYLANGGRVLLVTDEAALSMPNLMSVAEHYGLCASEGRIAVSTEGAESFTVETSLNANHDIIASMGSYKPKMVNANAIVRNEVERAALLVTPIVSTVDRSYIEGDAENVASYYVGYAVEEEVANGTTRFVWFTGADSFNGQLESADNLALLVYSTAWLNRTYTSEVGNISAVAYGESIMRVSSNAVLSAGATVIILAVVPITVGIVMVHRRKKR